MAKNYKARWVKRPSGPREEVVVGTGRFLSSFNFKSLVKKQHSFQEGQRVEFGSVAVSANGGYARVLKTSCWVPLKEFCDVSINSKEFLEAQKNFDEKIALNLGQQSATLITVRADTKPPKQKQQKLNPKLDPTQDKRKNMDKKELKTLITDLGKTHIGEEIEVSFRSNSSRTSGKYRLLEVKRGKGKGASMIARVEDVSSGHTMSFGTPNSDEILNVKWTENNEIKMLGYADESSVPTEFSHDAQNAEALKETFLSLIGKSNIQVNVTSNEASFAGMHTLLSAKKMAGRFGQIKLELEREDGSKFEIWSYRHSGIVQSVN